MSTELNSARRAMFQAFSECLVKGDGMTPTEIADRLLKAASVAAAAGGELPPLPEPHLQRGDGLTHHFTKKQMRGYARAAIAASRAHPAPKQDSAPRADDLATRVRALAERWNKEAIADGFAGSEPAYELFNVLGAAPQEQASERAAVPEGEKLTPLDFGKPLETDKGDPVQYIGAGVIQYKCARMCVDQETGVVYSSPYIGLNIRNVAQPDLDQQDSAQVAALANKKGTE